MKDKEGFFGSALINNAGRRRKIASLLLLLLLFMYPSSAFLQESEETLLRTVEDYIRRYYLYQANEENFPLRSVEEISGIFSDPYSSYLDKERMAAFEEGLERSIPGGVGIYLEEKDNLILVLSVVPGSPAGRAGLERGDVLISVDGDPVLMRAVEEVAALIRGEKGTAVNLAVRRGERILNFELVREKITLPPVEYTWVDEGIALLKIYSFGAELAREALRLLTELDAAGLRGLILDLRFNRGGYVEEVLAMSSLFTKGVLLNVREKDSGWQEIRGARDVGLFSVPLVVLVNGGTASAGEIMAAALKDNRVAVLMGEVTFGKGTMQTLFGLEGEGYLKLTTAEFTSPQGRTIEGCGVEPHYLVLQEGEQLRLAVDMLAYRLTEGKPGTYGFMEAALRDKGEESPQPLTMQGQNYFPLRALLQLTGREIAYGESPGIFLFYWDKQLFRLDIREGILTWEDHRGKPHQYPVLLQDGITYVREGFLEEGLGLPF